MDKNTMNDIVLSDSKMRFVTTGDVCKILHLPDNDRFWYAANGYWTALIMLSDSHKRIEELEHALRRVLPLFESYVNDMGTCDHSVGICLCEDYAALDELKRVLGENEKQEG
jgi:hypothetical protein